MSFYEKDPSGNAERFGRDDDAEALEGGLVGEFDEGYVQEAPNAYNVRNIFIIAVGGFVVVLLAFFLSIRGESGKTPSVQANAIPLEAQPPDLTMRPPELAPVDTSALDALLGDALPASGAPSEYQLQRQAAFQQALGLATKSRVGAPTSAAPGAAVAAAPPGGAADVAAGGLQANAAPTSQGGYQQTGFQQTSASVANAPGAPTSPFAAAAPPTIGAQTSASAPSPYAPAGLYVQGPFGPSTLVKGTLIPITLETAVHSDVGGMIIARTTEDVYDRKKEHVLIPRGSEVVSGYGAAVEVGGDRLDVGASRLNLPDGRFVDFQNASTHDPSGEGGLRDEVDRHYFSRFGSVALISLVGVGGALARGRSSYGYGGFGGGLPAVEVVGPNGELIGLPVRSSSSFDAARDLALRQAGEDASQLLTRQFRRSMDRPPTIRLRNGMRGVLILGEDIDMGQPYYENGGEAISFGASPFDVRPGRHRAPQPFPSATPPQPVPAPQPLPQPPYGSEPPEVLETLAPVGNQPGGRQ